MTKYLLISFLLVSYLLCSITACEDPPAYLEAQHMVIVDSLIRDEQELLKIELDSLCHLKFDEMVNHAVDSIMEIRLKEIKERLGK